MNTSLILDNPGLVMLGILACICLVLLPVTISAARRSRRRKEGVVRRDREPSISSGRYYDESPDDGYAAVVYSAEEVRERRRPRARVNDEASAHTSRGQPRHPEEARRSMPPRDVSTPRKPSAGSRFAWFLVGVCVGAGGLALWWTPISLGSLTRVMAFLDRTELPAIVGNGPLQGTSKGQDRFAATHSENAAAPATIAGAGGNDIGEMIERFVAVVRDQLPMAVGPGTTMVNADYAGNVVALGFTIAQTVAAEDVPKLQHELETRFKANVCGTVPDPSNIHGLNERGVTFIITYIDLRGVTVADMRVAPQFCSDPA